MKIKTISDNMLLASIPLAFAGIMTLNLALGNYIDKRNTLDDTEGRRAYTQLKNLADTNKDGQLSEMEKKLLCSRMDQNMPSSQAQSIARPYCEWSYCLTSPPAFFGGDIRERIEKTREMYEKEAQ